ncbi:MAG: HD domain-containing protein, partial [Candidatus Lokiarchaeota archaeon]|nr:HD domain-containing protein [Candidatus Lokiarchaeota archaeon]
MKKIIEFLNLIGNLKFEKRKGWIQHGISNKVESVADHSFRTALITLILSDYWKKKGLNPERMLKMALLHDLPEAIIGDITPRDEISDKRKKENEAMKTLINLINDFKEIDNIWDDFFEQKSEEARLVFQIDKLEMA